MGADLLVTWLAIDKGKEPDWDAGRKVIREADAESLAELAADEGEECAAALRALDTCQEAWETWSRDCVRMELRGADVLLTGGMSWGDSPSDVFDAICDLGWVPGALEAIGFDS